MAIGVYRWRNSADGKVYVGSSVKCLRGRQNGHVQRLRLGKHENQHLQRAWDKYGEESFDFEVLEEVEVVVPVGLSAKEAKIFTKSVVLPREQHWIDFYKAADPEYGYNKSPTAGNSLGCKQSDEAKRLHSESSKRLWQTAEYRQKVIENATRANNDPLVKAKRMASVREAQNNPEVRKRKSLSQKRRWQNMSGKARENHGAAVSAGLADPETRKSISEKVKKAWSCEVRRARWVESKKKVYEDQSKREAIAEKMRRHCAKSEVKQERSKRFKAIANDPEVKAKKVAAQTAAYWADPERQARRKAGLRAAWAKKSPEERAAIIAKRIEGKKKRKAAQVEGERQV